MYQSLGVFTYLCVLCPSHIYGGIMSSGSLPMTFFQWLESGKRESSILLWLF